MKTILFNEHYGLQQRVFNGSKNMTRREPYFDEVINPNTGFLTEGKDRGHMALCDGEHIVAKSRYAINEIVAVAQRYNGLLKNPPYIPEPSDAGWKNKMFVKAELMPHHIKITNIRCEKLQDISDDDCLREGIDSSNGFEIGYGVDWVYQFSNDNRSYFTPREAFAALIDKTSGKGTWKKNPYVFVYEFEKVD